MKCPNCGVIIPLLQWKVLERSLRLRHDARAVRLSKSNAPLLHFSYAGQPTDPARNIRDQAILMQQRLDLEAQATHWNNGDPVHGPN